MRISDQKEVKEGSVVSKSRRQIRLTIGTKLISLIAVLLMASVASLVWLSTRMFIEDNTALIQQMNADTAANLASRTREILEFSADKMRVTGMLLLDKKNDKKNASAEESGVLSEFLSKGQDMLALFVQQVGEGKAEVLASAFSPDWEAMNDPAGSGVLQALASDPDFVISRAAQGVVQVTRLRLADGNPAIAMMVPFIEAQPGGTSFTHILTAILKHTRMTAAFEESDLVTTYLVDGKGRLLAHTDLSRVLASENVGYLGIVRQFMDGKFNATGNGQTRYVEAQSGEARLGAFRAVGFAGLGVVAEVAEAKAFEAAKRVEHRSILVAVIILCLSFLAGYFFSGSLTWPIQQLARAARKIAEGDFKVELKPKGHDEVAELSLTFNDMAKGLEERDRVKATFNKFHNKEIAEKLLSGEVKLGGERKQAVIFFSDVRGFTGMSESMQPEQVVELLNEYMTRMVAVIRMNGGIVDKYVGDAIMALWGVPIGGTNDAVSAVRACLAMRQELAMLNELRLARGQVALKIGMGLNMGPVIAGNIGSDEKMEYTVIGDSVNLASRIESMTKEYGTDLLISQAIYERVKAHFVFDACESARVKGKSTAIQVYKVRGYLDEGREIVIETPYSSYAAEKSDKVVHEKADGEITEAGIHQPVSKPESGTPAISVPPPPVNRKKAA